MTDRSVFEPRTDDKPPWPTLDDGALYGVLGDLVRTIDPHTEADPAAVLADALTSFGNCVGPTPYIVADGARHHARLFAVIAGQTAKARKGTSRAQVRRVFEVVDSDWSSKRVMGGLSTGEGLIATVADPVDPDKPTSTDKRVLVVEPEFARVLGVASRESNILSSIIRAGWDDGDLRVMTRRDPLVATGAHISILGHITVDELGRRLTDTEAANGFANRFLWICARRSKRLPTGGNFDTRDLNRFGRLIRQAVEAARKTVEVQRTADAETLWVELYDHMADDDPPGLLGAVTARAEAQVLRLSLLYALTDQSRHIDVAHLQAAWAMWQYSRASAAHLFGAATGDPIADTLLRAIRDAGHDGLDLTAQSALFSRHESKARLAAARQTLEEQGHIATRRIDTGGRPKEVSYIITEEKKEKEVLPERPDPIPLRHSETSELSEQTTAVAQ